MDREDKTLAETVKAIRADEAAGLITEAEAAANVTSVVELHRQRCSSLRRMYLEGGKS